MIIHVATITIASLSRASIVIGIVDTRSRLGRKFSDYGVATITIAARSLMVSVAMIPMTRIITGNNIGDITHCHQCHHGRSRQYIDRAPTIIISGITIIMFPASIKDAYAPLSRYAQFHGTAN